MTRHLKEFVAVLIGIVALQGTLIGAAEWPQFRGPDGQGVAESNAPLEWNEETGVVWKTVVPGRGWSSPVVEGDQVWMTTAVERAVDPDEFKKRVAGNPMASAMEMAGELSLRAVCVDRQTGELLHDLELVKVENPNPIHSLNSYASPTPVIENGRLYCHFGRYGTVCVDVSNQSIVWHREFQIEHYVGPGSSPVLCDNVLVLTCDGADKQFIVAVDKASGETVWQTDRPPIRASDPDFRKSYSTPLVVQQGKTKEIVIPGAQWIIAYDAIDGSERWSIDHGNGFSLVPRPVASDSHIYCCTGYMQPRLLAVRRGGQGDIGDSHISWSHTKQTPTQPSPLLLGGRIFTVSDAGIGQCLDAASGEVIWKNRLPGNYSASPLSASDRVYFFNRDGQTTVVDAQADKLQVLASNELEGQIMATPAVLDGRILIRADKHLYAIGE